MKTASPLSIVFGSLSANFVPMLVLWLLSAMVVLVYYLVPAASAVFDPFVRWQVESGWVAAFLNRVIFCGLLPGCFLFAVRSIRPRRPLLMVFAYSVWGGCWGVACDWFFTLQQFLFGSGVDVWTLVKKTMADQLVWNVLLCTPANALFFPWVAADFHFRRVRSWRSFAYDCLVLLLANWVVWVPVTVAVYAFPLPLQIQLVGLAGAFWMLVALCTAAQRSNGETD